MRLEMETEEDEVKYTECLDQFDPYLMLTAML